MLTIATPTSDLFQNENDAKEIFSLSDCLECRDRYLTYQMGKQALFHTELQPIHLFTEKEICYLEKVVELKKSSLKLITFHMASSCHDPTIEDGIFKAGGYQYSRNELLYNAKKNFTLIKRIFGPDIEVGVENNNYYPTDAYNYITDPDFISDVVIENDIRFLFDISHAKISAYNRGVQYERYIKNLPLGHAIQIHMSKYSIINNLAVDAHALPDNQDLCEAVAYAKIYSTLRYLTIEYYRDISGLVKLLKMAKRLIHELS